MKVNGYGSRKFILAALTVVFGSALVWFGKVDGAVWLGAVTVAVGGYMGANVLQKNAQPE